MKKYILNLIEKDILDKKKAIEYLINFKPKAAYPDNVQKLINKHLEKISIAEKYRDKFLKCA